MRTGCAPSAVTTDTTGLTLTCAATSAGGTTSQSLPVIKRDATRPRLRCSPASPPAASRPAPSPFGFRLAAPATLRFAVERKRSGRKVGKRCLASTRANRRKPACVRFVRLGNITARGKKGANSLSFSGRVAGRKLAPGIYRISVVVIVGTATSKVQTRTLAVRR